jgi:DNA-binding beta-propeller fold protein YncE/mono/diheme cytochrome c family protein
MAVSLSLSNHRASILWSCSLLLFSTACKPPAPEPEDMPDMNSAARCSEAPLPLQNPRAHALGDTFYLPRAQPGPGCPTDLRWEVASAPAGSLNQVHDEASTWPRFTPDLPGDYTLRLRGAPQVDVALRVVRRPTAERFRNHYLTPLYGLARVGDEVWAAGGAAYGVARLSRDQAGAWARTGEVVTGAWPAALAWGANLPYVLVAQRGADSIGFIDRARGVLEDALPVGDEPSALALSPDGKRLYVSLPTMGQVAVVDLAARAVQARVQVGFDPRALALSADGARLFVASYRSGNLQDGPGKMRPPEQDQDIWIVDTARLTVTRTVRTVAADLRALALSEDGAELYVAATDGDTVISQADPTGKPFVHLVAALGADPGKTGFGEVLRSADLTRQPSARGAFFVNPAGVAAAGDTLWVSAESSNQVVALSRADLSERARAEVGAGPRHILPLPGGEVAVHCYRAQEVWFLGPDGKARGTVRIAEDPRDKAAALGEEVFYRPGGTFAQNHACASCHIETQNDGMVWNFGPRVYHNVRPLQLLEATTPIEWGAYVSNTANFGIQGPSSIMSRPPTQAEAEGLAAFLASLIGPPRATGSTRPDGSYSEAGQRGKALFERLSCAGCHTPGLYTNRAYIPTGKSGEPADVPTLLGVYRHGVYMVSGKVRGLEAAVDLALAYVKAQVSADERKDLIAFLGELTPKGAAPLGIWPDIDSNGAVGPDVRPWVRFSEPVDTTVPGKDAAALGAAHLVLEDAGGQRVAGAVQVEGGLLRFVPAQPLVAGGRYRLRVLAGLPFLTGGALEFERSSEFTVARAPAGTLPAAMRMVVTIPPMGPMGMPVPLSFDLDGLGPDTDQGTVAVRYALGNGLTQRLWVQLSGEDFLMQGFALPVGRSGVGDAGLVKGKVKKVEGGTATLIEGTLRLGAPGINVPGIPFQITPR